MTPNKTRGRCFDRDYEIGRAAAVREVQRVATGCDYGATSWTTRDEADRIVELLGLRPGMRLLDVGAGAGWPGLYFALVSGCEVVLSDVPHAGLRRAVEHSARDGTGERCRTVVADGTALPFGNESFDAIGHSDVLCCMPAKLELLQECRRVAREDARMAFSVIAPAAGLSDSERRIAIDSGPEFVDVDSDYATLLAQSNWRTLQRTDVTGVFTRSIRASLDAMETNAAALLDALGHDVYRDRLKRRQDTLFGLDRNVLKREVFVATTAPVR